MVASGSLDLGARKEVEEGPLTLAAIEYGRHCEGSMNNGDSMGVEEVNGIAGLRLNGGNERWEG